MRIAHRLVPGLVAGSLMLAGVSGAFAAQKAVKAPKAHWVAVGGQVANLSGTTFTLTLNPKAAAAGKTAKTVQVTLAATAREQARTGTTGTLANGDYAVVVGKGTKVSLTANRVLFSATAFPLARQVALLRARHTIAALSRHTVRGTVQSFTGTALTIANKAGKTLTFQVTPTTNFRANGQTSHTAPQFTTGQAVIVVFTVDKTTKDRVALGVALRA